MATHTEGWGCEHCGGYGHITFDTRPSEGVPPVYGACDECGYTFGCGEHDDFTHPDSYEYVETLHDMNSHRYWKKEEGWDDIELYTKEKYTEIIENAALEHLIGINVYFFSDELCRLNRPHKKDSWCDYCRSKEPLYVSPFINWTINPLEEK